MGDVPVLVCFQYCNWLILWDDESVWGSREMEMRKTRKRTKVESHLVDLVHLVIKTRSKTRRMASFGDEYGISIICMIAVFVGEEIDGKTLTKWCPACGDNSTHQFPRIGRDCPHIPHAIQERVACFIMERQNWGEGVDRVCWMKTSGEVYCCCLNNVALLVQEMNRCVVTRSMRVGRVDE